MAVSCTSLREKGDMLLSRATADREKEPQGGEGERSAARPGGLSPPGVWRGRVAQQAQRAIGAGGWPLLSTPQQFAISSCQPPLWLLRGPQDSYLWMINCCGRRHMLCPVLELVEDPRL